jgi:hypothetical protein
MRPLIFAAVAAFVLACASTPQPTARERREKLAERLRQEKRSCAQGVYPEHLDDIAMELAREGDREDRDAQVLAAGLRRSAALYRGERPPALSATPTEGPGRREQQLMRDRADFIARCTSWREWGEVEPPVVTAPGRG